MDVSNRGITRLIHLTDEVVRTTHVKDARSHLLKTLPATIDPNSALPNHSCNIESEFADLRADPQQPNRRKHATALSGQELNCAQGIHVC
jgi:hypothetical protein